MTWENHLDRRNFLSLAGLAGPSLLASSTTRQVASTLDLTATMLAAAKVSPAASHPPDGIDLLPVLASGKPVERTIFWRMAQRSQEQAVRHGGWKYLKDGDGEYLFDLVLDPGERHDRKDSKPEVFRALKAEYESWDRQMLVPVPLPSGPG